MPETNPTAKKGSQKGQFAPKTLAFRGFNVKYALHFYLCRPNKN